MSWTAYRLVYQAKSPIHIGWHTLGYIKLARYYITGKAMWGAITANLTRTLGKNDISEYKTFGALMKEKILASYFYPEIDSDIPLLPRFTNKGLMYGPDDEMPASEFERLFIKSFGQTAVMPHSNTAEDETLHESEFISSVIYEKDKQKPVNFVGYVFISNNAGYNWEQIKGAVSELFVGGDRKYGWGRLLLDDTKTIKVEDSKVFESTLYLNDKDLTIQIKKESPIPAHLSIRSDVKLKGDIEPLVGREWGEVKDKNDKIIRKGFGQYVTGANICWVPGSIMEEEKTLKIGSYGILE